MIQWFVAASLLLFSSASFASTAEARKGLLLRVDYEYVRDGKSLKSHHEVTVDAADTSWTALNPAEEGVAVIFKIHKPIKKSVKVDFLLIDPTVEPVKLEGLSATAGYHRPASISTVSEEENFAVKFTIEPTTLK